MNQKLTIGLVGVLSGAAGLVVGYKVAEKRLTIQFDERLVTETEGMREFYQAARKPYATPEEAVKELIPPPAEVDPRVPGPKVQYNKVVLKQEDTTTVVEPLPTPPVVNVFDKTEPYIISQDSFMQNDPEHEQATLTYYEASDQLCGENEEPIDNADLVAGLAYKGKFGHESSDPNSVHVRNDDLHMDFQIVKSEESYEEAVLGQEPVDTSIPPHKRAGR